jgi:chromate reductase, NAD(P)H dehydrogenase (quinone)
VPIKVKEFKSKIRDEDGILIATPEYNYSVPSIKNAIDRMSTRKTIAIYALFTALGVYWHHL